MEWTDREFVGEDFSNRELTGIRLIRCRFVGCSFKRAELSETVTAGSVFDSCDFTDARMGASEHRQGAFLHGRFENTGLFSARFEECKMTGSMFASTSLRHSVIRGGDWSFAVLRGLDLSGMDWSEVCLKEADLGECRLDGANLSRCDLTRAVLQGASLKSADLRGTNLSEAILTDAGFRGARMGIEQAVAIAASLGALVEWQ